MRPGARKRGPGAAGARIRPFCRSRLSAVALATLFVAQAFVSIAHAGSVVDRIKADDVIRCGGVSRPGLLGQSADGHAASGLYLDLCRAIGAALLGPDGRIAFHPYDFDKAFDLAREGRDDLAFLDGSEILDRRLAGRTILGPPVVFVWTAAMVREDSGVKSLADLSGRSVCFYQGSAAHRNLEAWMAAHRLDFTRMPMTEYGEMDDAYRAHKCDAVVGEIGDLAVARLSGYGKGIKSRILPEPLATFPVIAVTPASDPQWAAIVDWAIVALERAELPAGPWTAGGGASAAVNGADLGLTDDWAKRVVAAAGSYADIYARNLGDRSRLRLPRGPNAPVEAGGLLATPFRE